MNTVLFVTTWLTPLLLALLARYRQTNWLLPLAALPALVTAAVIPAGTIVSLPWLLLGSTLGIDETTRVLLGVSGLLWLVVAVYVAGNRDPGTDHSRFRFFFLLTMAGNLGLITAQDIVSFYFGFTLMGLSAYGLIARSIAWRARHAARRYLAWTIAGELLLFMAIIQLAAGSGGAISFDALQSVPRTPWVSLLLIGGFGIKLALPLLHWWLPTAYIVTPAAAVAVFSGVTIKAGLLGLLQFLPSGEFTPVGLGELLIIIGTITTAFGLITGLLQKQPRLLLGYSTISKMGILTCGVGAALAFPIAAPVITAALLIYVVHHALAKTALFLGLGLVERAGPRPLLLVGLGLLALVMAGAPLTSGALAKSTLSGSLPADIPVLMTLLSVSTVVTTVLMVRFMSLLWIRRRLESPQIPRVPLAAWLCLLALIMVLPAALADRDQLMINAIPVVVGLLLGVLMIVLAPRVSRELAISRWKGRLLATNDRLHKASMVQLRRIHGHAQSLTTAWLAAIDGLRSWLARHETWLPQSEQSVRHSLTAVLWLAISGGLMVSFILVK